jgi:hypothetical protein
MIQGKAKSRKTFFLLLLNWLILRENLNIKNIVVFDTEQFKHHSVLFKQRLKRMSDRYEVVKMYNIRRYSKDVRFQFIQDYLQKYDIDIAFIDNLRDVFRNFNNLEQSDDVLTALTQISENIGIHICCCLHENPGDMKARGHIGTEMQAKCETVFNVTTTEEDDITIVKGIFTRNGKFEPATFKIEDGLPVLKSGFIYESTKEEMLF